MPLISSFCGIQIYLYLEANSKHKVPHFHARYNDKELVVSFTGKVLEGEKGFPPKKRKLVEAWAILHTQELMKAWKAWNEDGVKITINGLR